MKKTTRGRIVAPVVPTGKKDKLLMMMYSYSDIGSRERSLSQISPVYQVEAGKPSLEFSVGIQTYSDLLVFSRFLYAARKLIIFDLDLICYAVSLLKLS